MLPRVPPIEHLHGARRGRGGSGRCGRTRKPLTLLYLIVVLRTLTALSFATFMPVMLTRRGMSVAEAGTADGDLPVCDAASAGFFGGPLADRWGPRQRHHVVAGRSRCRFWRYAPMQTGWTFVAVVSLGGFLLQSTLPVNVTFGQMIAPISAATVSSLMMGFAWGTGGLSVPFVGMLADRIGIERDARRHVVHAACGGRACALPLPVGKIRPHASPGVRCRATQKPQARMLLD